MRWDMEINKGTVSDMIACRLSFETDFGLRDIFVDACQSQAFGRSAVEIANCQTILVENWDANEWAFGDISVGMQRFSQSVRQANTYSHKMLCAQFSGIEYPVPISPLGHRSAGPDILSGASQTNSYDVVMQNLSQKFGASLIVVPVKDANAYFSLLMTDYLEARISNVDMTYGSVLNYTRTLFNLRPRQRNSGGGGRYKTGNFISGLKVRIHTKKPEFQVFYFPIFEVELNVFGSKLSTPVDGVLPPGKYKFGGQSSEVPLTWEDGVFYVTEGATEFHLIKI